MFNLLNAYIVMYKYPRLDQHVNVFIQVNEYRCLVELNNSEKPWKKQASDLNKSGCSRLQEVFITNYNIRTIKFWK